MKSQSSVGRLTFSASSNWAIFAVESTRTLEPNTWNKHTLYIIHYTLYNQPTILCIMYYGNLN
jgi:hypothetical protein